jgi:hypothetical protein
VACVHCGLAVSGDFHRADWSHPKRIDYDPCRPVGESAARRREVESMSEDAVLSKSGPAPGSVMHLSQELRELLATSGSHAASLNEICEDFPLRASAPGGPDRAILLYCAASGPRTKAALRGKAEANRTSWSRCRIGFAVHHLGRDSSHPTN